MVEQVSAYPLAWPPGYPRTPAAKRRPSRFRSQRETGLMRPITVAEAYSRLMDELDRLHATSVVLSTNLELRRNGQPRSDRREPADPGAVVYFHLRSKPTVVPCDAFDTVGGNMAAIAGHIEAVRRIERYRVGTLEQMFTGFQAIRGPGMKPWREVLGFRIDQAVTREMVEAKRRELAKKLHPDAGGSGAAMAEVNGALEAALEELADAA